jgi:vacuolar-type H+-ATPase subunit I/STV1
MTNPDQNPELSEVTVEPSVIPEIQSILDEIDVELKEETAGQLKKIIKERLTKIKKLEAELQREKAAFATLVQMNPTEFANLTGNQKLLSDGQWVDTKYVNPVTQYVKPPTQKKAW